MKTEDRMSTPAFDNEAIHLLSLAGIKPTVQDVTLLGDDLAAVANEFDSDDEESAEAYNAAMILKRRIGGLANLESYMRCLRVPKRA